MPRNKKPLPTRLRMLSTQDGSYDGAHVATYEEGEVYDADTVPPMTPFLAEVFVQYGMAEDAGDAPSSAAIAVSADAAPASAEGEGAANEAANADAASA